MQAERINFVDILCPPSLPPSSKPSKGICMLERGTMGFECHSHSGAVTPEHLFKTSSHVIPGEKKRQTIPASIVLPQLLLSLLQMDWNSVLFHSLDFHWPFTIPSSVGPTWEGLSLALGARAEIRLRVFPHTPPTPKSRPMNADKQC